MNRKVMKRKVFSFLVALAMVFSCITYIPVMEVAAAEVPKTATERLEDLFTTVDLIDATIADLQAEMTAGNVTSVQLTQMYIDRIPAVPSGILLPSPICTGSGRPRVLPLSAE